MNELMLDGLTMQGYIENIEPDTEIRIPDLNMAIYDLSPAIRYDVPDCRAALVSGDPYGIAPELNYNQGDNPYNAKGNCGLVSVSNLCRLAGLNVTENNVTRYALDNKLCADGWFISSASRGGVDDKRLLSILDHYGIEAKAYEAKEIGGSYDSIAKAIESGKGVMMGLNAGYLWDEPRYIGGAYGEIYSNHEVVVTGSARDAETGKVIGFYICDSGHGNPLDACRYVSLDTLNKAYMNANNASVIITDTSIRR